MITLNIDPSLKNFGLSLTEIDPVDRKIVQVLGMDLIETEKTKVKTIRVSSDKLARARAITLELRTWLAKAEIVFVEVPTGGQSASASSAFGIVVGILAGIDLPMIEVQPAERGMVVANRKSVSKEEVTEWGFNTFPDAPWKTERNKPGGRKVTGDNEHIADSLAICLAGMRTAQFKEMMAMHAMVKAQIKLVA